MIKKVKSIVAKVLANKTTGYIIGRIKRHIDVSDDIKIDISSPYVSNTIRAYLFWGMYESAERRSIEKYFINNVPVVELGASMGVITSVISQRNPPIHIAVEGNPNMIPLIKENIRLNNLTEPIILNKVISYSGTETVKFRLSEDNTGSSISDGLISGGSIVEIDALTLSQLLEEQNINEFILVADIEGAEAAIFYHDKEAIVKKCILIIIELHDTRIGEENISIESMKDLLVDKYRFRLLNADGDVYVFANESPLFERYYQN